jgi:hypothetical protein
VLKYIVLHYLIIKYNYVQQYVMWWLSEVDIYFGEETGHVPVFRTNI